MVLRGDSEGLWVIMRVGGGDNEGDVRGDNEGDVRGGEG